MANWLPANFLTIIKRKYMYLRLPFLYLCTYIPRKSHKTYIINPLIGWSVCLSDWKLHILLKTLKVVKKLENESDISFSQILQELVKRFQFKYKKELGLEYVRRKEEKEAIKVFEDILHQNDSLVKAWYGMT